MGNETKTPSLKEGIKSAFGKLDHAYERGIGGLSTGLKSLDKYVGGMEGGDLVVIAGRPGTGKTSLALSVALHTARGTDGDVGSVLFCSLEQTAVRIAQRAVTAGARASRTRAAWPQP